MAPYQQNIAGQMPDEKPSASLPWRLFVFIFILFLISFLGYAGLNFGYKPFLNNSIAETDAQIQTFAAELDLGKKKEIITFYSQIVNLKALLKSHIFVSKIFPFIESTTAVRVAYTSMEISTSNGELRIEGVADSFDTLVQQLLRWQNHPAVDKLILQDNSPAEAAIKFSVALTLIPGFFIMPDAVSTPVQSVPATTTTQ